MNLIYKFINDDEYLDLFADAKVSIEKSFFLLNHKFLARLIYHLHSIK